MSIELLSEGEWLSYSDLQERVKELARRSNLLTEIEAKLIEPEAAPMVTISEEVATLDIPNVAAVALRLDDLKESYDESIEESEAKIIELTETIAGLAGGQGSAAGGLYFEDPGHGDQYVYASDLFFEYDTTTSLANYRGVTQAIEDGSPRIGGTVTPAWYAVYEGGFAALINKVSTSVQLGTETNSYSSPDFFLSPDNGGPLSHVEVRINFSLMGYTAVAVVAISFVAS